MTEGAFIMTASDTARHARRGSGQSDEKAELEVITSQDLEDDQNSSNGLGPAGVVMMVVIGMFCALAPRLGWNSSAYGVDHFAYAFMITLALTGITVLVRGGFRTASPVRATALPAAAPSDRGSPGRQATPTARRSPAKVQEEQAEDALWNTDWTDPAERGEVAEQLKAAAPKRLVEVFELNDTPTWLARLQLRREQAHRAGKNKLVQKIDKEIADAVKANAISPQHLSASQPSQVAAPAQADSTPRDDDDIWSMDWTALSPTACEQ
ncbi:unnamed protein product [Polarella glacialis]|uniref:Uncharacterized protein n=1 Tax=Polarella glacialis TaxID=89957 RepID=A0A813LMG9_POLGL|nr:unnamed protein product [Polarella glacialis]|mmetsp:Transcript_14347/g.25760  ORF Transcript_14347/g.25760 Transcript_14347/m.25760 type:complete len:267 (+) Transcript_14347:80-880(+)